jgi:hypothetical protein
MINNSLVTNFFIDSLVLAISSKISKLESLSNVHSTHSTLDLSFGANDDR